MTSEVKVLEVSLVLEDSKLCIESRGITDKELFLKCIGVYDLSRTQGKQVLDKFVTFKRELELILEK